VFVCFVIVLFVFSTRKQTMKETTQKQLVALLLFLSIGELRSWAPHGKTDWEKATICTGADGRFL